MIEFEGEVSQKCKMFIAKKEMRVLAIIFLIPVIIMGIPAIFGYFLASEDSLIWLLSAGTLILVDGICSLIVIIMLILSFFPKAVAFWLKKETYKRVVKKIIIDEDIIEMEDSASGAYHSFSDVKQVNDYGEWYQIKFYFPHKTNYFVCQKDLITKGTIEEFEELFKDKIIRKIKGGGDETE